MKKIIVFQHSGFFGGSGKSLLDVLSAMKGRYEIIIYCNDNPEDLVKEIKNRSFTCLSLHNSPQYLLHFNGGHYKWYSPHVIYNLFKILMGKKSIYNIIKNENPDLVIVNSMTLCWIGKLAKKLGKKSLCFCRETLPPIKNSFRNNYIINSLNRQFDYVSFISEYDLIKYQSTNGIVIHDKVPFPQSSITKEEACRVMNVSDECKYILYLGGMNYLKGADVIIKAMPFFDAQAKLIFLAYEGFHDQLNKFEKSIKDFIDENNLLDRIIFRPIMSDVSTAFLAADVVVFPANQEHQARPLFEAAAYRRPCVITDFECLGEFAFNNYNVLTFEQGNHEDLAKKINVLFNDRVIYETLVKNNYETTLKNHNIVTLKEEINGLISTMLK